MMNRILIISLPFLFSCELMEKVETKITALTRYEYVALDLARKNRQLQLEINNLQAKLAQTKSKNNYLTLQLRRRDLPSRGLASIKGFRDNDMVKYDLYQWKPEQILSVAKKSFKNKEYEKASQYFNTYIQRFPSYKNTNDELLFQAGMAAFQSRNNHQMVLSHFTSLINRYPQSQYYLGAKLWMALTYLQLNEKKKFYNIVEEFNKKYRNAPEWEILSGHYDKIVQNYKN